MSNFDVQLIRTASCDIMFFLLGMKHDRRTRVIPQLQPEALRPAWAGLPGKAQAAGGPGGHRQAAHR